MTTTSTKTIADMKVQFVMVLLVVLAGDQQSEVNALQEHHLEVVQLLRLNAANLGIEAVHTEGVVEELDRDHDTGDDNAVNGERVHRDFPTLNQAIDIDEREDEAFCTTVRVLQNPARYAKRPCSPFKIVVNRNGRLAESREWSDLGNRDELRLTAATVGTSSCCLTTFPRIQDRTVIRLCFSQESIGTREGRDERDPSSL